MATTVHAAPSTHRTRPWWREGLRHARDLGPIILAHVGAVAIFWTGGTLSDWLILVVLLYFRGLLTTVGYHRYFAHRSFKTSRVFQFIMAFFCCSNLQQGPIWWAGYHRKHHRHSDDPNDPHSPYHGGFFWAYCAWLFVPVSDPDPGHVRDLRKYPELLLLERFWLVPGILFSGLCLWLGGWSLLCVGFCLSAVVTFHMTSLINTLGHIIGSRRYKTNDNSTNSFLLAAFSLGDGWHNNHHHYPHAAQAGFFPREIDGSYRVICLLEWLGLIWNVRRVPPHKLHPPADRLEEDVKGNGEKWLVATGETAHAQSAP